MCFHLPNSWKIIKFNQIMSRTPLHRIIPSSAISLIQIQQPQPAPLKISNRAAERGISHYSPHISKINFKNELNATTGVETNAVYDSRKQQIDCLPLEDWKILTLKQIKKSKIREGRGDSYNKSHKKIFLSISKSNRGSSSEQKRLTPSNAQLGESSFKLLESLSKKQFIVEQVQEHIDPDNKPTKFFCE